MAVEYYRTGDPIENLRLTVYVREICDGDGSNYRKPITIQTTLTWQQKLFSPAELNDYLQSQIYPRGTAIQMETRGAISRLERSGTDIKSLLSQDPLLFTLIDRDHYIVDEPLLNSGEDGLASHPWMGAVSQKLAHDRHRQSRSMHLLLATDNETDKHNQRQFNSHPLLSLSVTPQQQTSGNNSNVSSFIVAVQGLLSRPAAESTALSSSVAKQEAALSLFLDESSATVALSKGFLLTSQRVRSGNGRAFEVAILCDRDVLSPLALADISRQTMINDSIKAAAHRPAANPSSSSSNNDSSSKKAAAPKLIYRMAVDGCWDHHTSSLGQGIQLMVTASSSTSSSSDGSSSWQLSGDGLNLNLDSSNSDSSMILQWISLTAIPSSFSLTHPSFLSHLSRMIIATVFMLISIAAVAVGDNIALWLLPVITLVVAAFIDFTDDIDYDRSKRRDRDRLRLPKEATVLPLTMAMAMTLKLPSLAATTTDEEATDENKDDSKNRKDEVSKDPMSRRLPSIGPNLLLSLFSPLAPTANNSNGNSNNNADELTIAKAMRLLGEGSCPLPCSPGPFIINLQLTRPIRGIREELAVLFLGRPPQLKPTGHNSNHNKGRLLGSASMAAGWIRISGHVTAIGCGLRQRQTTTLTNTIPTTTGLPTRMISSVEGMGARERVAALLGGRVLSRSTSSAAANNPATGPRPSVKAVLESLNLRSRPPSVTAAASSLSSSTASASALSEPPQRQQRQQQSAVIMNASANAVAGSAAALLRAGRNKSKKKQQPSGALPPTTEGPVEGGEITAAAQTEAEVVGLRLTEKIPLQKENSRRRNRYDGEEGGGDGESDTLLGGERNDANNADKDNMANNSESQPLLGSDK